MRTISPRSIAQSRYTLYTLTLLFIYTGANIAWLHLDTRPPHSDSVIYIQGGYRFLDAIQKEGWRGILTIPQILSLRPPLQSLIAASVLPWTSGAPDRLLFINVIWQALSIWFTFRLGEKLGGQPAGFLAAVFLMTDPFVHSYMQQFETEIPLMVCAAASLLALLRIVENGRLRDFIELGIWIAAGLLFKWIYAVFMAAPLAYGLWLYVKSDKNSPPVYDWKKYGKIAALAAIPAITALPWYLPNFAGLLQYRETVDRSNIFTPFIQGWQLSVLWYYPSLIALRLKIIHLTLLAAGAAAVFISRNQRTDAQRILLASIGLSLLFFWIYFSIQYKNIPQKYALPLQPFLALIAGCAVRLIPARFLNKSLTCIPVILLIVLCFNQWRQPSWLSPYPVKSIAGPWLERQTALWTYDARPPQKGPISHVKVADCIRQKTATDADRLCVYVLPRLPDFNFNTLSIWLHPSPVPVNCAGISQSNCLIDFLFHDFFILSQGLISDGKRRKDQLHSFEYDVLVKLSRWMDSNPPEFMNAHQSIGQFLYNQQTPIVVYQRIHSVQMEEAAELIGLLADEIVQYGIWKQVRLVWERMGDRSSAARIQTLYLAFVQNHPPAVESLLQMHPNEIADWRPHERYWLGLIASQNYQTDRAVQLWETEALSNASCAPYAALRLADYFLETDHAEKAIAWLSRAWNLTIYEAKIPLKMTQAYDRLGEKNKATCFRALSTITEQLAIRNDRPDLFAQARRLLLESGFDEEAAHYADRNLMRSTNPSGETIGEEQE